MMKRTKIICTLGPAVDSESALKNLVLAGMDVARCNFSHGSHAEHKARMDRLKKVRREPGRTLRPHARYERALYPHRQA